MIKLFVIVATYLKDTVATIFYIETVDYLLTFYLNLLYLQCTNIQY